MSEPDSCGRHDDTLLEDEIEEDLEYEIECLTYTVPGPGPVRNVTGAAGTDAWKDLMSRMQGNQQKPLVASKTNKKAATSKTSTSKAIDSVKKGNDLQDGGGVIKDDSENMKQGMAGLARTDRKNDLHLFSVARPFAPEPDGADDKVDSGVDASPEPCSKKPRLETNESSSDQNNDNGTRNITKIVEASFLPRKILKRVSAQKSESASIGIASSGCAELKPKPPPPAQLFPIFMPKSKCTNDVSTNGGNGICSYQSQHNFNHVIYDYPEIQDGWNTQDKTEVTLHQNPAPAPVAAPKATNKNKQKPRTCPFYKMIPGTKFSVDAFSYGIIPGIDVYFLSHFHSDHYVGLTKKFSSTVVCSRPTGNLVHMKLGVAEDCIRKLELNKVYVIQGAEIVLIEANHCPGSVIFLFRLPNGSSVLHTGDFRYTPDILTSPFVKSLGRVSCLYLDTTYCDPRYDFPAQADAVNQVITTVQKHLSLRPRTLILCGAYCIGKERVFFSLAEAINTKVYCGPAKFKMLFALDNSAFNLFMRPNEDGCRVHVVGMGDLNPSFLSEYLSERSSQYNNILAIRPSGWEFSKSGRGFSTRTYLRDTVTIIGVPYSEHSSFSELRDFVMHLKPIKVQPTVNVGNEAKRNSMMRFIDEWQTDARQF